MSVRQIYNLVGQIIMPYADYPHKVASVTREPANALARIDRGGVSGGPQDLPYSSGQQRQKVAHLLPPLLAPIDMLSVLT